MARSVLSALNQTLRALEREAARQERAAARRHAAAVREAEQARRAQERAIREAEKARKAQERANRVAEKAAIAEQKRLEKEAKAAHVAAMEAQVEAQNLALANVNDEIDTLLAATLSVDDFVDLEKLRRTPDHPPFDRSDLEVPTPPPAGVPAPEEPVLILPDPPSGLSGFFGGKKKHELAIASAEAAHAQSHAVWKRTMETVRVRRVEAAKEYARTERERVAELERERRRFEAEIVEHNEKIDALITNLNYGAPDAVQEYVSIVVSNSVYPEHFQVEHSFTFEPATAELEMRVVVPPPGSIPSIKAHKYKKSTDEITATTLSQRELKDRYAGAVHQVAIRSFHEVFEADRRGIIKLISLEVGTEDTVPATGKLCFIPFVAAAAEREMFMDFDLSSVVPVETLKHLGAAISKNPYGLVAADTTGIRRS